MFETRLTNKKVLSLISNRDHCERFSTSKYLMRREIELSLNLRRTQV